MTVSGDALHLDLPGHHGLPVKTESVLSVPSMVTTPVVESFVYTTNDVVSPELLTMPLMSASTVAGQRQTSASDGTSLSLSASTVPSLVPSTRCKTESTDVLSSSFSPVITDVRSVKMEPEVVDTVPLSSNVVFNRHDASSSNNQPGCNQMKKAMVTDMHCTNDVHFHPSCVTSGCSSSSSVVSCSLVSLHPLTSFAGSTASKMTNTAAVGHSPRSVASAVVKLEFSPTGDGCLSSLEDSVSAQHRARNTAECSSVKSTKFADSESTAHYRVTRTEDDGDIGLKNPDKSSETVACSSDIFSEFGKTLVRPTHDTVRKKCSHSRPANIDGSVKERRETAEGRQKSETESHHGAVTFQSPEECKLTSLTLNVESRKRKLQTTAKAGMYWPT